MRRTLAAAVVALSLAATGAAVSPSFAADGFRTRSPGTATSAPTVAAPSDVLRRAEAALDGVLAGTRRPDATLALRDLFATLPRLSTTDRAQARAILARPTQGDDDPYGDGYTVGSKRRCTPKICIHWVPTTADAPPSGRWVTRSLRTMKSVWTKEVGKLGYRRPVTDGRRGGGSDQFDVYLSDVGAKGLYGYCAPEFTKPGYRRLASGYCVLDNDFARAQFGARPSNSLKVTAAHEFFHAIQFAYDYLEDPWMMEATATWMGSGTPTASTTTGSTSPRASSSRRSSPWTRSTRARPSSTGTGSSSSTCRRGSGRASCAGSGSRPGRSRATARPTPPTR
jgi:hypothetical protein